ncbi:DUF1642 domain-containing protein [Enterococcus faecium]|uniref:DUF1642 domain-containing protein n=1 Tax=Enterococcus faecium TaxID=1352 RepID=UPI000E095DEC|nr:DUF1642 domain-containing protein [Enterococcus faecium]RDG16357.1 DUF1642 domain-containing protein [Enterococcus faecium]
MNKKELIDKQELIDELAKYVKSYENAMDEHGQGRYGAYEVSLKLVKRLNESKITDEQAWNKVAEAYPESAQSLRNTLDNAVFGKTGEHQKPVVPKFVAEWFEENKDDLEFAIWELCVDSYGSAEQGMLNWIQQSENKSIETLIRMKDGYEVEKEPLYYVRLPYEVWDEEAAELKTEYLYLHYEITSDETRIFPTKEPRKGFVAKLDELTIKSADENYWPFAVPVEKV